ncbi:mechanosensitive ion channel protein 4-like isoform X1 [Chenopodium quinoa]|uniref:mechanosensitive ion channel protein 4-like isoform X1 n=1 Tax=Chenopodium quinoa TaxID=63459 RepID=UPI000B7975B7|nr:mechanosensitive ion channel protein 4-like isoform X1 [Chenopodium quinoa]
MIIAVFLGLIITCSVIAATVALPLLLVSFLVIRLLQFFSHGDAYDKAVQLMLFIRAWILIDMVVFLIILWIFFWVPKNISGLRHVLLLGLTLADWVSLYYVIFGIYILSCFVSVVTINLLPLVPLDHTESGLILPEAVLEIIDCLIFWLAESEVMKRVSTFKHHKILGLNTQNWIEVSIFVLVAYNVITLSTYMIVWLLRKLVCHKILKPGINTKSRQYLIIEKFLRGKHLMYWANGMKRSINFILRSLLLLITWVSYFGSKLNKTPQAKYILDFGTWTCLSLLICSFLWLVKTCVLLSWEACSVYNRLNSKILEGGKQLYFLGIIGRHNYDILNLLYECKDDETLWNYDILNYGSDDQRLRQFVSHLCKTLFPNRVMNLHAHYLSKLDDVDEWGDKQVNAKKLLRKKHKRVKHDLLIQEGRTLTLYCIQQAAGYFLTAKQTLLKEKYTSDILENLKSHSQDDDHDGRSIKENLKRLIQVGNNAKDKTENSSGDALVKKDDWGYFEDQLHEYVGSSQDISPEIFHTWMERACNNCLFLANTLSSAKEVVDCLNKIISWLLIVATFIMWLLLTGLASTKVLVIIASPLLAATFIFGDACKTLFQGIMFAYVIHPFDVGDLCVIDGNMVEVKTIGVWKSTFSKVGMQEEVLYPNSELCNKNIINYKTEFDWNDYLELDTVSLDEEKIKILKQEIEKYLDDGENGKFTPGYNCVEVVITEENIKIAINFRHNVNLKNSTYFECLKEKRKRRSEFILHAQCLVNHMKNGRTKTSESYEDKVESKNGSLMNIPDSGDEDDTFVAGKVEGVYGG